MLVEIPIDEAPAVVQQLLADSDPRPTRVLIPLQVLNTLRIGLPAAVTVSTGEPTVEFLKLEARKIEER